MGNTELFQFREEFKVLLLQMIRTLASRQNGLDAPGPIARLADIADDARDLEREIDGLTDWGIDRLTD